jgi:hypothetical protein
VKLPLLKIKSMPIYFDKEKVFYKQEGKLTPVEKFYKDGIDRTRTKFKDAPLVFRSIKMRSSTGIPLASAILNHQQVSTLEINGEFTYSTADPVPNKHNIKGFKQEYLDYKFGEIILTNERTQLDLAFYMFEIYLKHNQDWVFVDEKKKADEVVSDKRSKINSEYLIFSEDSPLSGQELRTLARGFCENTTSLEKQTDNQVRDLIAIYLEKAERKDKEVYQKFVRAAKNLNTVEVKANIVKAISSRMIEVNYEKHTAGYKNDSNPFYTFTFDEFGNEIQALANWAEGEGYSFYRGICLSLGIALDNFLELESTNPELFKKEVRKYAQKVGIKIGGKKNEDLEREVKEHYNTVNGI